ncbi:MAG: glycine cleavage system aminomethyltransferase GcvT [Acidimicrobiia bacterium]|nr:glycine cleavage system aminomethyltransferase GcvT [Acidimicrobiia bacterium]
MTAAESAGPLRRSPLDAVHRNLGAKLVEFGGWDMPIQYAGVLVEHRACRTDAVAFDVSHLGSLRIVGPGAFDLLQRAFTNDLGRIAAGRAQYTHLLDPTDAHVEDDIIVWWVADDEFLVMPNASNTDRIVAALQSEATADAVSISDVTAERAVIAVQGPRARELAATVSPAMAAVPRFAVARVEWQGTECVVAGTGYTGEDGFEVHVPFAVAPALWRAFMAADITPAGLGARDTLRLEAGLPLHGHELGEGITPLQAGLGWVVRWDKGEFRGRDALAAEKAAGVTRRLRGLVVEGRRPPRAGCSVLIDGAVVGEVTSGNFSPILEHAIALAFLPPDVEDGAAVAIDVRGSLLPAVVTKPPFVR